MCSACRSGVFSRSTSEIASSKLQSEVSTDNRFLTFGAFGPANMPPDVVEKVSQAFVEALALPD